MSQPLARPLLVALLSLAILPAVATAAKPSVTIENVSNSPHGAAPDASLEDLQGWIEASAAWQRWSVLQSEPGRAILRVDVRRHTAIVDVTYDENDFSIAYRDSINLNYSEKGNKRWVNKRRIETPGPRIHPNYNRWVADLANTIRLYVSNPPLAREVEAPRRSSTSIAPSIADEIERLEAMRERGAITDEEFSKAKARLLDP